MTAGTSVATSLVSLGRILFPVLAFLADTFVSKGMQEFATSKPTCRAARFGAGQKAAGLGLGTSAWPGKEAPHGGTVWHEGWGRVCPSPLAALPPRCFPVRFLSSPTSSPWSSTSGPEHSRSVSTVSARAAGMLRPDRVQGASARSGPWQRALMYCVPAQRRIIVRRMDTVRYCVRRDWQQPGHPSGGAGEGKVHRWQEIPPN